MSLFETEDEWAENWFEDVVDELEDRVERDTEDREKSGFADKPDEEWAKEKKHHRMEEEMKEFCSDASIAHRVTIVKNRQDFTKK